MPEYILSVVARDRSGIIAEISAALFELGGNILSATQSVLGDYFAMMILCATRAAVDPKDIRDKLGERVRSEFDLFVTERQPASIEPMETQTFVITLIGPDRPGILHALTSYLASKQINIDDLRCQTTEGEFLVICQVSVPNELDLSMLQADLEESGRELQFTAHMQHENVFIATNELRFGRAT
ncbi:MAG: ACT domain-containing protein [Deltaproteobacteria bacterium]|nr:ACT domain-containing protein [Deltaproteobacteria bacterium]